MNSPSPTVSTYVEDHPETALGVVCKACGDARKFPWERVAKRMLQRRLNPVHTGVAALAEIITEPCPKCAGAAFETKVAWPDSPPQVLSYAAAKKRF